jgi:hypothetical protein
LQQILFLKSYENSQKNRFIEEREHLKFFVESVKKEQDIDVNQSDTRLLLKSV